MLAVPSADIWRFQPHLEVWVLVGLLIGLYVYAVKVIGPKAVPPGVKPVTSKNVAAFVSAMLMLWFASDWPVHDIAEEYLYSVHMVQHMMLSYFLAPLALLATPQWLARVLVGQGRTYRVVRTMTRPVFAAVFFNLALVITHIPGVVNASVTNGLLHYGLHLMVVLSSLLFWMPVCGPLPELRLADGTKMIYLFAASILPTVPAGWLTFAEGSVYDTYDHPVRLWGLSVTTDQQLAGAIMKLAGSAYLWVLITVIFFRRVMAGFDDQFRGRRRTMPSAEVVAGAGPTLTYDEVVEAFGTTTPPAEPAPRP